MSRRNYMRLLVPAGSVLWSLLAFPVSGVEPAAWHESALSALEQGDYETADELAQDNVSTDPTKAGIILFGARAVEYERTHDTQTLSEAEGFYNEVADKITMSDAVALHRLRNIPGDFVYDNAETLLDTAITRIDSPEQAAAAAAVLHVVYEKEKYKVCSALAAWLAMERDKARKGKQLTEKEKEVFGNRDLIAALMDNLDIPVTFTQVNSPTLPAYERIGDGPSKLYLTSPVPRSGSAARSLVTNATAKDCLLLMGESAVPVLQSMKDQLSDDGRSFLKTLESK